MRIPTVQKCCCCLDLRIGVIALAALVVILDICYFIKGIVRADGLLITATSEFNSIIFHWFSFANFSNLNSVEKTYFFPNFSVIAILAGISAIVGIHKVSKNEDVEWMGMEKGIALRFKYQKRAIWSKIDSVLFTKPFVWICKTQPDSCVPHWAKVKTQPVNFVIGKTRIFVSYGVLTYSQIDCS